MSPLLLVALATAGIAQVATTPREPTTPKATASANEEVLVMNPFEVTASSNVGYRAESTSSSGRLAQAYVDIPQTVDVITSEFMQDFNLTDSRRALSYVPSVFMASLINDGVTAIRGTTVNAIYFDGMASSGGAFGSYIFPTEFYDRLEVVKGPSSAAFGLGQPGGIINFITKKPQGIKRTELTFGVGDHENYRSAIDTQGGGKALSYRLIVAGATGDDLVKELHSKSLGAQLALKYQFSPNDTLQIITSYNNITTPGASTPAWFHTTLGAQANGYLPYPGQPNPAIALPRLVDKAEWNLPPGWNTAKVKAFRTNLILDHQFGERASLRNSMTLDHINMEVHSTFPAVFTGLQNPSPGVYMGAPIFILWPYRGSSFRDTLDFVAKYDAFGAHMRTLVGGEFYRYKTDGNFQINFAFNPDFSFYTVDIYDASRHASSPGDVKQYIVTPWISTQNLVSDNKGYGFYVQQEASLLQDKLTLMAAWRLDYLDYKETNRLSSVHTQPGWQNTGGAPRYAITFKPKPWFSIYGLYTEHKDPTKAAPKWIWGGTSPPPVSRVPDLNADIFVQPRGYTEEAGIKAMLMDDKLGVSVAAFRAINSGGLIPAQQGTNLNPDGTLTSWSLNTEVNADVKGLEATVAGQIGRHLIMTASYARANGTAPAVNSVSAQYTKFIDPPTTIGVHGKYEFGNRGDQGLYATFGAIFYSPFWFAQQRINNGGPPLNFYWDSWQYTADVGLGYRWGGRRPQHLALTVNNVTNQLVSLGSFVSDNYSELPLRKMSLTYTIAF